MGGDWIYWRWFGLDLCIGEDGVEKNEKILVVLYVLIDIESWLYKVFLNYLYFK